LTIEIQCPDCGEVGHMVSVERVYQHYPVFFNEDGGLEFEGTVLKEFGGTDEGIECRSCGVSFTRGRIERYYSIQVKGEDEQ